MESGTDELLDINTFLADYREREWIKDAACRGMDTNIFFPERGDNKTVELAKEVCAGCSVREQCLEYGRKERFGFWGGMGIRRRRGFSRS